MKVTPKGPARIAKPLTRSQAFRNLAEHLTRTRGLPCATVQYDIATQDIKVIGTTGSLIGAQYRSSSPTPLLAYVLSKRVPVIIPDIGQMKTQPVSERITQSGGREFLDTGNHIIIVGGRSLEFPRRQVRAALPIELRIGAVLIYPIPSNHPDFRSQGFIIEHATSADRFTTEHIREGEIEARNFAFQTSGLSFEQ